MIKLLVACAIFMFYTGALWWQVFRENRGDRPDAMNVALLITDGYATLEQSLTLTEAMTTKQDGAVVMALGQCKVKVTRSVEIGRRYRRVGSAF